MEQGIEIATANKFVLGKIYGKNIKHRMCNCSSVGSGSGSSSALHNAKSNKPAKQQPPCPTVPLLHNRSPAPFSLQCPTSHPHP